MMSRYHRDEGIVLTKRSLLKGDRIITIFSKQNGKIVLYGFGTQRILSRRLSHLETGNYIKFSYIQKDHRFTLQETELMYGYSNIKSVENKIHIAFTLFFILNKILPENTPEPHVFVLTETLLKKINSRNTHLQDLLIDYLKNVLIVLGFINEEKAKLAAFDPIEFIEGLIGQKIKIIE